MIEAGERDAGAVEREMVSVVDAQPLAQLDYAVVVRADNLQPLDEVNGDVRLLAAARVGKTRLIDNLGLRVAAPGPRQEKETLCDVG